MNGDADPVGRGAPRDGRDPGGQDSGGQDPGGRLDPTKMANQPALRTSSGNVWVIVGFLFAAASMIPLAALIFVSPGASAPVAWVTAIAVVVLFAALVLTRFLARPGVGRLRRMAVCFLAMAVVALIGVVVSAMMEAGP